MRRFPLIAIVLALPLLAGCFDHNTRPHGAAPAAPRGLTSITGDGKVTLTWLANTESDVVGYRIYVAPCATGHDCPYDRVGFTAATSFDVTQLSNGVKRYFAVSAVDVNGNESDLSYDTISDVPRPAGTGLVLTDYVTTPATSGYDFSQFVRRDWNDPETDIFYGYHADSSLAVHAQIFVPDFGTNIQDAGFSASLDAVDFAPASGWSPSGTVEAIVGHCYVVWTRDNHYAKFQVTAVSPSQVTMDWAYQTAVDERELKARPVSSGSGRRPLVWLP